MLQTEPDRFLTTKEAAERLNCNDWHIRGLLRAGILKGTKISHKAWRIPESAIQELINSGSNFLNHA
jgi:excisionase family DNA binding protein